MSGSPAPEGILLINKPAGMTSHDVVDQIREVAGTTRVGHAGTLDPLATGLLIVGVGRATKQLSRFLGADKEYEGVIRLGAVSDTDDAEGKIRPLSSRRPGLEEVRDAMKELEGRQLQLPPRYSAVKVGGVKAYEAARRGKSLPIQPREVEISSFEPLAFEYPDLAFRVRVSSGTYIRSLARDLGERIGIGGYLASLCRTAVGSIRLDKASSLKEVTQHNWTQKLFDLSELSDQM